MAALIKRSGLKQKRIAMELGVDESWISRRVSGRVPIEADDLPRLAAVLNASPCDFFKMDVGQKLKLFRRLSAELQGISPEEAREAGMAISVDIVRRATEGVAQRAAELAAEREAAEVIQGVERVAERVADIVDRAVDIAVERLESRLAAMEDRLQRLGRIHRAEEEPEPFQPSQEMEDLRDVAAAYQRLGPEQQQVLDEMLRELRRRRSGERY